MDLQVYAVIAIVFFVSLCSLLYINKHARGNRTFEDVLAEKRQFADKLYGNTGGKNYNKKNTKKLNTNNNKKTKDRSNNKKKEDKQTLNSENDAPSDSGSGDDGNASPSSDNNKLHVEFLEAEIIASGDNTVTKKPLTTGKRSQQQAVRKNSSTKPPGSSILLNKNDAARPSISNVTIELNHFEESQPKDDLEVRKHRDESLGRVNNKKEQKRVAAKHHNNNNKKDHSPKVVEKAIVAPSPAADPIEPITATVNEIVTATVAIPVQKESPKNQPNKDKLNKKKKNEALLVQKLVDAGVASSTTDDVNVNVIMQFLGRTELTRGEIQILIDFLLNKQQDTINVTNCDWSDDIVQKLRKQLDEKDRQLGEEQSAAIALHTKLRELRAELNNERSLSHQRVNANAEKLNSLTEELHQLQQDYQLSGERYANEKKTLEYQLKQHQAKLYQEKQLQGQESAQKIQQLTESNNTLTAELLSKNAVLQELQEKFLHMRDDSLTKLSEYEQKFQEYVRQSETDAGHLNAEIQRLHGECTRKDEYEKLFAIQKYDLEQLEARVAEQNKANNHLDDTSKVEIRNLQNALDSTKSELTLSRKELADGNNTVGDLTAQLADLKRIQETNNQTSHEKYAKQVDELNASIKSYQALIAEKDEKLSELGVKLDNESSSQRENELLEELAAYKNKNNDLRQKNWKLVDALRTAEDNAKSSSSSNHSNLVTDELNATIKAYQSLIAEKDTKLCELEIKLDQQNGIQRQIELFKELVQNNENNTNNHDHDKHSRLLKEQEELIKIIKNLPPVDASTSKASALDYITRRLDDASQQQNSSNQQENSSSINGNGTATDDDGAKQITEDLILQNAKLKSTVDEYKTIVAETESVLKSVEKKAKEQDSYWRNVLKLKDVEIENLKQNPVAVNSS